MEITAKTENPSFEIIAPLLSRTKVLVLNPLDREALLRIIADSLENIESGIGKLGLRIDQAALDVKSGRIDVLMAEAAVINSFEKEMDGLKVAYIGQMSSGPVSMVLPEGDAELAEKLNAAIAEMLDSGFIDDLAAEYMQ